MRKPLVIRATGSNTDFEQTVGIQTMMEQAMTVAIGVQNYEQDFINYFEPVLFPADTVQTPDYFIAAANYATMGVDVTWSPKDDLYSGFIIYRGLTDNDVLGEVKRGERFQLVDDGGAPGYTYIYAIQAYLDTPAGRKYSLKTGTSMIYPILLPVQHLMANEIRGANRVAVRWGHAFDNHDSYVVTRNDVPVAAIKAGEKMEYIDSTGVPGERYLYAVYAERKVKGVAYLSEVRTVELDYPDIARVEALTLQQYGTLPGRNCDINPPPIQSNRVKVDWTIDSTKVDGFEIYRNQTLIATIGNDSTHFIDNNSIPETANTYEVIAFVEREQLRFFSRALSETITLAAIPSVSNFQIEIQASKGRTKLTWDYFSGEAEEFIISYTNPMSNKEEIARIRGGNIDSYSFLHKSHPTLDILYRIEAVKKGDNATYSSAEVAACNSVIFPKPPNIPEFFGTNKVGHTALIWEYDPEIAIDYFKMSYHNSVIVIDENDRVYDLETTPGDIYLEACRAFNGVVYCSDRYARNIQPTAKSETQVIAKSGVQSIAVDGDILVFGRPDNNTFEYYKNEDNEWKFGGVAPMRFNTFPFYGNELGKSVAVEEDRIVAYDGLKLRHYDISTHPNLDDFKFIPIFEGFFSAISTFFRPRIVLTMDKGKLFTAAPIFSTSLTSTGADLEDYSLREIFKLDGGNYVNEDIIIYGASRDPLSVWDMAVDNGTLVSGHLANDEFRGGLGITKVSDLDSTLLLNALDGQQTGLFGSSVDISGDYAIGGSTFLNKVFIYKKDGTDWIGNATLAPPSGINNSDYGEIVAIDGDLAAVSVTSTSNSGVRIYKKDNDENWNFVKFFQGVHRNGDMVMNDKFVFSSDLNNLYIHSLLNAPEQLTSDGTATSELKLNWTYEELQIIDKFRIYRDGVEIGTVARTNRTFSDTDGIPGKTYTYQVVAYAGEQESVYATIKGTRKADGKITGSVKTLTGQAPVSGATIILEGIVYADEAETRINRTVSMTTTTNGIGEFEFTEVYYGEFGANFTVLASYKDHTIKPVPNTNTPILNSSNKQAGPINFFDEVGLAIVGQVRHADEDYICGLDSIKVMVWSKVVGVDAIPKSVKTDKNGNYSLAIDPNQQGLEKIYLTIENFRTSFGASMDTTFYNFKATAGTDTLFLAADFPTLMENEVTTVNFEQTITYPALISIKNTCGEPIYGEQFKVRIRDAKGCYDKTVSLNPASGELMVDLPPIDGLIITAVEAVNKTSIGSIVLDYLKFRPGTLNLLTAHNTYQQQLAQKAMLRLTDEEIVDNLTKNSSVKLTFHITPTITVANFGQFVCAEIPHKLQQEDSVAVSFQVSELQNGVNCAVQEGYVVINNPAAKSTNKQLDTIYFDPGLNRFPAYSFLTGAPNIVSPYSWGMELSYFTETGSFLKTITIPIVIEGSSAVPGYDVIVDPDDEIIPYPLYILRDPPGDNSSTTLKAGKTFSTSISNSYSGSTGYKFGFSAGFRLFGFGGGTDINVDVSSGGSREMTLNVTGTVTESISTGTGNKAIGEQGDIIVGMGVAYQYGLIENIEVVGCGEIRKSVEIGFTPSSVATKWVYTIDQIERIREDNIRRVADIDERPLDEQKEKEKERMVLENTAKNWDEVLIYHREKTLPHLVLCNVDYAKEVQGFSNYNFRVAAIAVWQEEFCQQYGQSDLIWDDEAVNAYNNALSAIKELADNDNSLQELQVSLFDEDLWQTADGYSDPIFDNQFGKAAENTTFSANTSITRSLSLARSSTTSQIGFASVGTNLSNSLKSDSKLELVSGTWAGFGAGGSIGTTITLANTKTKFSQELSFRFDYKHTKVNSVSEAIDMSYTLSDDDTGDQHSVTVVQGVSPTHSPYFYRFGGRSSCPPEDGTIIRDDPKIQIIDPETGTAKTALQLFDQDPNQPVILTVRVTNNNPFDEARFITAYLDNTSNGKGARLKLAGSILGEVDLFNKIPSNVPQDFTLTLERNVAYQYDNIKVGVWASCGGPNQNFDEIDLSVHFQTPCSPVTIVSPNNNWVANGVDDTLVVKVRDYQPDNTVFERLKLQYRRVDVGDDWDDVNVNELLVDFGGFEIPGFDPPYSEQRNPTAEFLGAFNQRFIGTPSYPIIWAIPNNVVTYPDGKYEVRVMATCEGSENPSNVISGTIDRSALRLLTPPEPADGLWLKGDGAFKAAFNQNLDCPLLSLTDKFDIMIVDKSNNNAAVPFTPVCFNNELTFDLGTEDNFMDDFSVLQGYDGHTLEVIIAQATAAVSGNQLLDTIRWEFDVVTQKLYWATDTINVELYADELLNFSVDLIETPDIQDNLPTVSLKAKDGIIDTWLKIEVPNVAGLVFDPDPAGKTISFTIDGGVGSVFKTNKKRLSIFVVTTQTKKKVLCLHEKKT